MGQGNSFALQKQPEKKPRQICLRASLLGELEPSSLGPWNIVITIKTVSF
jgi:hypothetical protein